MSTKLDILFFAAHPDDVELAASGVILKFVNEGKTVGIVDLTRGELGTRGSAELRDIEAKDAANILGISVRENLALRDGRFVNDESSQQKIIEVIRKYQPDIVVTNAPRDRHPDHGRASVLVKEAAFFSGLRKIESHFDGVSQKAWRPKRVYSYIQDHYIEPDFVIDITPFWDKKIESIKAYKSQFFDPDSKEPVTPISTAEFQAYLEARAVHFGRAIGVKYAEGFLSEGPLRLDEFPV